MYEKEKQVIQYLLSRLPGLTKTQLIKAIYLADYVSRQYTGKPITSFEYIRYEYGPYDFAYPKSIDDLIISHSLVEKKFTSSAGREGIKYFLAKNNIKFELVSPIETYILKHIEKEIAEKRSQPIETILDKVYSTEPMQEAEFLETLNMGKVDNSLRHTLEGNDLEETAIAEYQYEHGQYVYLEDAWKDV